MLTKLSAIGTFVLLITFFNLGLAQTEDTFWWDDDFGPVQREKGDAEVIRYDNLVTYRWQQMVPWYGAVTMEIQLNFNRGYDYMQQIYGMKNHGHGDYNRFILNDPFRQDLFVLANELARLANQHGLDEVALALSFVQALSYQEMGGYQRYAVETLVDGMGDCSDKSVLFAGILAAWGYDAVFIDFPTHLAVGLRCDYNRNGVYWFWNGGRYYFCETTKRGWSIGECPEENRISATIDPVDVLSY